MNKTKKTLFDFIDLGEEIENVYLARERTRKDSKKAYWTRLAFIERKQIEKIGLCQNCENDEEIRWCLDNEFFLCYNCFVEQLGYETEHDVPPRSACQHRKYMDDCEWSYYWEEENEYIDEEA